MERNIEIKARVANLILIRKRVEMIADSRPSVTEQEDTFFNCPNGYLKLRKFSDTDGELIYYRRPDSGEPRESQYIRSLSRNPRSLCEALSGALGVRKPRTTPLQAWLWGISLREKANAFIPVFTDGAFCVVRGKSTRCEKIIVLML